MGTAIALGGLIVAVLAWQFPQAAERAPGPSASSAAATGTATPDQSSVPRAPSGTPTRQYLDTMRAQSGGANIVALPRRLTGRPGYEHALVLQCPTNQNNDRVREVTFLLRGRYLDFSANVRPYFSAEPDSAVHVFAIAGVRERDDTLTRREVGRQLGALMATPAPIAADVEAAEELTLQVRCESPNGVIALTEATVG